MPKISLRLPLALLAGTIVVAFDVLVISGWALSGVSLVWGIYLATKFFLQPSDGFGFKAIACIVIFGMTSIFGYSFDAYVQADFLQFRKNSDIIPKDKGEFLKLGESQLSWFSKWSFLGYANVDGTAVVKLRMFPYRIAEYDFNSGKFLTRPYD